MGGKSRPGSRMGGSRSKIGGSRGNLLGVGGRQKTLMGSRMLMPGSSALNGGPKGGVKLSVGHLGNGKNGKVAPAIEAPEINVEVIFKIFNIVIKTI